MEWTDEKVLNFIEEYKSRPSLWDPNHPDYKLINKKNDSWRSLAHAYETDVAEVKRKINSLLASFRRLRRARTKSNWFAYNSLTFLLDKFKVKTTRSSEDTGNYLEKMVAKLDANVASTSKTEEAFADDLSDSGEPNSHIERPKSAPRGKKRKLEVMADVVEELKKLRETMITSGSTDQEDECDIMGKHVAIQMRTLPVHDRLRANVEIQKILMDFRLKNINTSSSSR